MTLPPTERVEERAELALRLVDLVVGLGAGDDPGARVKDRAIAHSPSPRASIHPTGPAYRPRSNGSRAEIASRATSRGVPPTAGVGCSAATRSSADGAGSLNTPWNLVERCHTFGVSRSTGSGSHASSVQNGCSVSATASTTISCSSRSFEEPDSASAFARSSAGSPDRGAEPASGFDPTSRPRLDSNSSGDAPTKLRRGPASPPESGTTNE